MNGVEIGKPATRRLPFLKIPLTSVVAVDLLLHSKRKYWAQLSDLGYYVDPWMTNLEWE